MKELIILIIESLLKTATEEIASTYSSGKIQAYKELLEKLKYLKD